MSKTDDFYKLAALRAAEGFTGKAPGKTKDQQWKKAHPEKYKEVQRRYIRKHRDKWNAYMREWRRKKKEAAKAQEAA